MANYATLKAAIAAAIKQNGNNEITGNLLQQQLLAMVDSLGVAGFQFAGVATPSTNPGTPDQNVFYIAIKPGQYPNFNSATVGYGQIGVFSYNGAWSINVESLTLKQDADISNIKTAKYYATISGSYVSKSSGQVVENVNFSRSDYIPVFPGEQFFSYLRAVLDVGICFYNENKTFISGINIDIMQTITVPSGAFYMIISTTNSLEGRFAKLITEYKSLQDIPELQTSDVWEKYANESDANIDNVIDFGGYVEGTRRELYNIFKTVKLYGFDATKKHTVYVFWVSATVFNLRISEQRGSNDWVQVFYYNVQLDQRTFEFSLDVTVSGKRVVALIDSSVLGIAGIYGYVFNALNTNPEYVFAGPCYMDAADEYTAGDGILINNKVISTDPNTVNFPDIIKLGEPGFYNIVDSDFSLSGFIDKSSGQLTGHATYTATGFFPCAPGQQFLTNTRQNSNAAICFYDADKVYHNQYYQNESSGVAVFTVPDGAYYMRLSCAGGIENRYANLQNYSYLGLISLTDQIKDINEYGKPAYSPIKLYPKTKLPCVSFQFDDIPAKDSQIVALFETYKLTCAFAFIASESNILEHGPRYVGYQRKGFQIMNHSINGTIYDTTNYTYQTAMAAIQTALYRIQGAGMVCNGFVAPSSSMAAEFMPILKLFHAYAFTSGTSSPTANGRNQDPCDLHRYSMQSHTLAEIEEYIDDSITNDQIMTFYGHAADLVDGDTSVFSLNKIAAIIEYCIAKRNAGQLYVGGTDDCVKYYFGL